MLGLKLATDPRWVTIVEGNIEEILSDHAWCEQKAASNAITIMTIYSEYPDLVDEMTNVAREELEHFQQVHTIIQERGLNLAKERKDPYVNDLLNFMKKGGNRTQQLVERLLFAAMIEARSCERFRVLSENISDTKLASFYRDLMVSEAGHYTLFLKFARKYGQGMDVDKRWKEWLDAEAEIIANYGTKETVHG